MLTVQAVDSAPSPERRHYLAEWYQPDATRPALDRLGRQLAESARAVATHGAPVQPLLTLCLPADEVAFGLFLATSRDDVATVLRRADLQFERITEAFTGTLHPHSD